MCIISKPRLMSSNHVSFTPSYFCNLFMGKKQDFARHTAFSLFFFPSRCNLKENSKYVYKMLTSFSIYRYVLFTYDLCLYSPFGKDTRKMSFSILLTFLYADNQSHVCK